MWLVFMGWVISYANEWEDFSNYFGDRVEISRNWVTTHSLGKESENSVGSNLSQIV